METIDDHEIEKVVDESVAKATRTSATIALLSVAIITIACIAVIAASVVIPMLFPGTSTPTTGDLSDVSNLALIGLGALIGASSGRIGGDKS